MLEVISAFLFRRIRYPRRATSGLKDFMALFFILKVWVR